MVKERKQKMKKLNHNNYNNYDFFLTTAQPFWNIFQHNSTFLFLLKLRKGEVGWNSDREGNGRHKEHRVKMKGKWHRNDFILAILNIGILLYAILLTEAQCRQHKLRTTKKILISEVCLLFLLLYY